MIKYSFEQWCLDNDRQDLLDRWDYEKTGFSPNEISYSSAKMVYFKCPCGLHDSELRRIYPVTSGAQRNFICKQCNKDKNHQLDDLTGQKFGQLVVLRYDKEKSSNSKNTYWICKCSCGKEKSINATHLKRGLQVTCGNRKIHWTGENASNWKGGITPINVAIRTSEDYDVWRKSVFKKDGYKCLVCGDSHKLEAHHIYPFSTHLCDRFKVSNGASLCYFHHSMYADGSFHKEYGTHNNTPEQLEEYINRKRQELGIAEPFNIYDYMSSFDDDDMEIDDYGLDISSFNPECVRVSETGICSISIPLSEIEI